MRRDKRINKVSRCQSITAHENDCQEINKRAGGPPEDEAEEESVTLMTFEGNRSFLTTKRAADRVTNY